MEVSSEEDHQLASGTGSFAESAEAFPIASEAPEQTSEDPQLSSLQSPPSQLKMAESILRRMMEEGIYTKEELCAAVGRACKKLSLDQVLGVFQEVRQKQTPQSETQTPSKAFRGRLVRISEPVQLPQTTEEEHAAVPETEH